MNSPESGSDGESEDQNADGESWIEIGSSDDLAKL